MQIIASLIKPGITTAELDIIAENIIRESGAIPSFKGYQGFPFATCISVNEQVVHGFPSSRPLQNGDIVGVDVGACVEKYHADAAITVACGNSDSRVSQLMSVTKNALALALNEVKPNNHIGDISAVIQKEAEDNGMSVIRDLFGHGVGLKLHEDPMIPNFGVRGQGPLLKEGMVLAIEPMLVLGSHQIKVLADGWTVVTQDGSWSAHEEHTVAVTSNGCKILTR